jgi:hypothetical protein
MFFPTHCGVTTLLMARGYSVYPENSPKLPRFLRGRSVIQEATWNMNTKPLRFVLPRASGDLAFEISVGDVDAGILPSAEHEAGHAVTAHEMGARVYGIAIGFIPNSPDSGSMFLKTIYSSETWSAETHCTVKAAGPAADVIYWGRFDEAGAKKDLSDIEALTGIASFEPYLTRAKEILSVRTRAIDCIADRVRRALAVGIEYRIEMLPGGQRGAMLVEEAELLDCFTQR